MNNLSKRDVEGECSPKFKVGDIVRVDASLSDYGFDEYSGAGVITDIWLEEDEGDESGSYPPSRDWLCSVFIDNFSCVFLEDDLVKVE